MSYEFYAYHATGRTVYRKTGDILFKTDADFVKSDVVSKLVELESKQRTLDQNRK